MKATTKFVLLLFILYLFGYSVQYGLNIYLAHEFTVDFYGDYNIAIKLLTIFVSISLFGTDVGSQCFLSRYLRSHANYTAMDYISWNIKLISISFLCVRFLAYILMFFFLLLHMLDIRTLYKYPIPAFVLWVTPIAASLKLLSNYLLSCNMALQNIILYNIVFYIVEFFVYFIMFSVLHYKPDYLVIAFSLSATYLFLTIITVMLLKKNILVMIFNGIKELFNTPITKSIWFNKSGQLILNNIIYLIVGSLDLFIVKLFSKSSLDVGHYAAILTIVNFIWVAPGNLYQKLKPSMSNELTSVAGRQRLQRKLNQTNKVIFLIMTTISLLVIIFSYQLLSIFGHSYTDGVVALIILTICTWFAGLNQIAGVILLYADLETNVLIITIIQFVLVLLLVTPATYYFGIIGTATATGIILALNASAMIYLTNKKLGINTLLNPMIYFK